MDQFCTELDKLFVCFIFISYCLIKCVVVVGEGCTFTHIYLESRRIYEAMYSLSVKVPLGPIGSKYFNYFCIHFLIHSVLMTQFTLRTMTRY